jgi:hypothetical protein
MCYMIVVFLLKNAILYRVNLLYWPYRLTVRTSAFQAGNPGSIPGRVTRERWLSGRRHRSRKAAGVKAPRGFKSLPFRSFCFF